MEAVAFIFCILVLIRVPSNITNGKQPSVMCFQNTLYLVTSVCAYTSNTSLVLSPLVLLLDSYKSHNLEPHAISHLSSPVPEPMSKTVRWPSFTDLMMACLKAAFLPASLSMGRCQRSTREFANLPCSSKAQGSLGHPIWAKQA